MLDYELLPVQYEEGLRKYIEDGVLPGHFLSAVLKNDLKHAVSSHDKDSYDELKLLVSWCHWEIPGDSYGSAIKVRTWNERGGINGK